MSAPLDAADLARRLDRRRFGRPLVILDRVESTNDEALALLAGGSPEGTLVVAVEQIRGRGRLSRSWASPPGRGIYATLLLRPALPPVRLPLVTFAAAAALARHLEGQTGLPAAVKWPNDVLLDGRKVAGLLAESRGSAGGGIGVVVGLGLNLSHRREDFPAEARDSATSLSLATGEAYNRQELLSGILLQWEEEHRRLESEALPDLLVRWERQAWFRPGMAVRVSLDGSEVRGRYRGLGPGGELSLELENGGGIRMLAFGDAARVREG